MALPFLQSTLRESPALATKYLVGVISTTLPVHPVPILMSSYSEEFYRLFLRKLFPYGLDIFSSTFLKASSNAFL